MEKLLKVSELSEIFNVSDDRIYTLAREQVIPSVRVGRTLRFSRKAIEEFIANGGKALPENCKKEIDTNGLRTKQYRQ